VTAEHRITRTPEERGNWWVLAAVGVGTFMSALDASIVNTVLPVLTQAFHTRISVIEWIVTVYLLVVSGLLLSVGRWGDIRGHKPIYLTGFVLFVLGSALCGAAPTAGALIAFRGLQAFGAAMLFASSPAILTGNFPAGRRGQVLGMQATMTYLGLSVGPPLGGWLAVHLSWRAVFYINIPVGAVALLLCWRFIPNRRPEGERKPFDIAGATVFVFGLVSLLLALDQGDAWGWASGRTLGLVAFALVALAVFVRWESRVDEPMLDLSLFGHRTFTAATASAFLNYVSLNSVTFVLPFCLISGRGMAPDQAGLVLIAQPIIMAMAAPISGFASDRVGTRFPAVLGMAILALGIAMLTHIHAYTPIGQIAVALMVIGLGTGIFISPNNSALMGSAPRDRQGIASGILATARNTGMVIGVGLSGAIYTAVLARHGDHGAKAVFAGADASFIVGTGTACLGVLTCLARVRPAAAIPAPTAVE